MFIFPRNSSFRYVWFTESHVFSTKNRFAGSQFWRQGFRDEQQGHQTGIIIKTLGEITKNIHTPGKHSVPFFKATVAVFRGKVDGNSQQLVFQAFVFFWSLQYCYKSIETKKHYDSKTLIKITKKNHKHKNNFPTSAGYFISTNQQPPPQNPTYPLNIHGWKMTLPFEMIPGGHHLSVQFILNP